MAIKASTVEPPDLVPVRRAILSVSDRTGLAGFAQDLSAMGIEIISTGGTAAALKAAGIAVRDIADLTCFPEIMDGRLKTLHPAVHGGLLANRDEPAHQNAMREHAIVPIDLAVINLYPFESVSASGASFATIVENIDVGGPAMIRAAAKNHAFVLVATDPADYAEILAALQQNDGTTRLALRSDLAARAFARTAAYDAAIAGWLAQQLDFARPRHFSLAGKLREELRYGENPHQQAALYRTAENRPGVASATQLQGKQLSWNNLNDTNAAFELVSEFDPASTAAVAIIKHANPCGAATAGSLLEAWKSALACDPVSAFGGIIAVNRELDGDAAMAMAEVFAEVIIAPAISAEALEILSNKKNLRVMVTGALADPTAPGLDIRSIAGGFLLQSRDNGTIVPQDLVCVTRRAPSANELADLIFAFRVAKHVKSNAIVYAKGGATVGIGAGQMSRVDASRIAVRKAGDAANAAVGAPLSTLGSVVASDAFFPFADGLISAIEAGATAVIQPGGSMRDDEVIKAGDDAGIAMVFTGMRHFRH